MNSEIEARWKDYLMPPKRMLWVCGPQGCGKTTFINRLILGVTDVLDEWSFDVDSVWFYGNLFESRVLVIQKWQNSMWPKIEPLVRNQFVRVERKGKISEAKRLGILVIVESSNPPPKILPTGLYDLIQL